VKKPERVDGILEYPNGYRKHDYTCKKCGDGIFAIFGGPGVEICYRCAIMYSTHKVTRGCVFHATSIKWRIDKEWYGSCRTRWHPRDRKCKSCQGVKEKKGNNSRRGK